MKGNILYAQGKKKEAEAEYRAGAQKGESEVYQEAVRYNQLGRFYADSGQYQKARELYDRAVKIDPYYIEGTTNKGVTLKEKADGTRRWNLINRPFPWRKTTLCRRSGQKGPGND